MYILSQVLVVMSDLLCIASMLSKNKKGIVFYLILTSILFISHYICLGAWTGTAIALVDLIFLLIMYVLEAKNKEQYNIPISIITIIITVVLSIITWEGWISIFPMLAMVIYLIVMMFKNVVLIKIGSLLRFILNGIYMLLVKSYLGAGMTVAILIFTLYGIIRDAKKKQTQEEKDLLT